MTYYLIKIFLSALLIAAISEVAKYSSLMAAFLASLPMISLLSLVWFYTDTHNTAKVASLSWEIFFLVLPSLIFFVSLPILLKWRLPFYGAILLSALFTSLGYGIMLWSLRLFALRGG